MFTVFRTHWLIMVDSKYIKQQNLDVVVLTEVLTLTNPVFLKINLTKRWRLNYRPRKVRGKSLKRYCDKETTDKRNIKPLSYCHYG